MIGSLRAVNFFVDKWLIFRIKLGSFPHKALLLPPTFFIVEKDARRFLDIYETVFGKRDQSCGRSADEKEQARSGNTSYTDLGGNTFE